MRLEPQALFNLIHKFNHLLFIKLNLLHLTLLNHYTHDPINKGQPFRSQSVSIIHTIYLYLSHSICMISLWTKDFQTFLL